MHAQKVTVGRIVHFVPPQANVGPASIKLCAAIVTVVNADGTAELATLGPSSLYFQHAVPFSEEYKPGCFSWPPKV